MRLIAAPQTPGAGTRNLWCVATRRRVSFALSKEKAEDGFSRVSACDATGLPYAMRTSRNPSSPGRILMSNETGLSESPGPPTSELTTTWSAREPSAMPSNRLKTSRPGLTESRRDDHALHDFGSLVCFSGRTRDVFIISSWSSSLSGTRPRPPHVGH
jgi:hypothetical protein